MVANIIDLMEEPIHHDKAEEDVEEERTPELQKLYDDAARQFPPWSYAIILGMTLFTVFYAFVKSQYLTPCNPAAYWSFYFSPVIVLGGSMLLIGYILNGFHRQREEFGYHYLDTDVQFTTAQLKKFPSVALIAGLAAGMLGIGGGMIIGPLFIELGMEPQVGTSSCAFMILWTACSGVIQYYYAGKLGWKFLCYFAFFGFISGQIGQQLVNRVLRRTGRPSIVVLLLGSIILLACIAMVSTGILKVVATGGQDLFVFTTHDFTCGGTGGGH